MASSSQLRPQHGKARAGVLQMSTLCEREGGTSGLHAEEGGVTSVSRAGLPIEGISVSVTRITIFLCQIIYQESTLFLFLSCSHFSLLPELRECKLSFCTLAKTIKITASSQPAML